MATWPAKFPRPQRVGYTGSNELPMHDTSFPASTKRRKTFDDPWMIIKIKMVMSLTQFNYFWSWLKYKDFDGAQIVQSMPILDSDGVVRNFDGFIQPGTIEWEFKETVYTFGFDFRVPNFTVPTESAFDIWLAS